MITLKVNKKDIKIPTSWYDIKFSEYEMVSTLDEMGTIAFFLGMTKKELEQYTNIQNYDIVVGALSFLKDLPVPDGLTTLTYNGKNYNPNFDILDMSIGQYRDAIDITNRLTVTSEYSNEQIKLLITTYLQPTIDDSTYDATRVDQLVNELSQQLSVQDYINIQDFFLRMLIELKSGTKKTSSRLNIIKKKIWQGYMILKRMVLG